MLVFLRILFFPFCIVFCLTVWTFCWQAHCKRGSNSKRNSVANGLSHLPRFSMETSDGVPDLQGSFRCGADPSATWRKPNLDFIECSASNASSFSLFLKSFSQKWQVYLLSRAGFEMSTIVTLLCTPLSVVFRFVFVLISVFFSVCLSICMSVCLFVRPSVCPHADLSI